MSCNFSINFYLWSKRCQFEKSLYGEEQSEEEVEVVKDVHVGGGGAVELEREQQRVHDDQEKDEVLEGGRGAQPPQVVSKHFIASLSIYQISTTVTYFQHYGHWPSNTL